MRCCHSNNLCFLFPLAAIIAIFFLDDFLAGFTEMLFNPVTWFITIGVIIGSLVYRWTRSAERQGY